MKLRVLEKGPAAPAELMPRTRHHRRCAGRPLRVTCEALTVTFAEPVDLDRIRIAPGHAKKDFTISPRPDDVQLVLTCAGGCEPTKQVTFADKAGYKTISLTARGVTQIQVLVRSVHGSGGGVAFAELQFQRKRPKVN